MKKGEKPQFNWKNLVLRSCWAPSESTKGKGLTKKITARGAGFAKNVVAAEEIKEHAGYLSDLTTQIKENIPVMNPPPDPEDGGRAAFLAAVARHQPDLKRLAWHCKWAHRFYLLMTYVAIFTLGFGAHLFAKNGFGPLEINLIIGSFALIFLFIAMNMRAALRFWQIKHRKLCSFSQYLEAEGLRRMYWPA